jgi:hypothetical protein
MQCACSTGVAVGYEGESWLLLVIRATCRNGIHKNSLNLFLNTYSASSQDCGKNWLPSTTYKHSEHVSCVASYDLKDCPMEKEVIFL